jgi:hypothetical protein
LFIKYNVLSRGGGGEAPSIPTTHDHRALCIDWFKRRRRRPRVLKVVVVVARLRVFVVGESVDDGLTFEASSPHRSRRRLKSGATLRLLTRALALGL